jgi:hypothetical protein
MSSEVQAASGEEKSYEAPDGAPSNSAVVLPGEVGRMLRQPRYRTCAAPLVKRAVTIRGIDKLSNRPHFESVIFGGSSPPLGNFQVRALSYKPWRGRRP